MSVETGTRLVIAGPLPPQACSPNGYKHWRTVSAAKREQRQEWNLLAQSLLNRRDCRWGAPGRATATIEVGIKGARGTGLYAPRDEANALAALKAAIDGIIDAGVLPDDSRKHLRIGGITISAEWGPGARITLEVVA